MSLPQALPAPERDFRRPGCTEACRVVQAIVPGRFGRNELLLHDPDVHERYGRFGLAENGRGWIVKAGPVAFDFWSRVVTMDGGFRRFSGREWAMLEYLAIHPGRFCSNGEILRSCWSEAHWDDDHILRVNFARIRSRLNPYGSVIENQIGIGYRLLTDSPIDWRTVAAPSPVQCQRKRWAPKLGLDACRDCDRSSEPHRSHGLCHRCFSRRQREDLRS